MYLICSQSSKLLKILFEKPWAGEITLKGRGRCGNVIPVVIIGSYESGKEVLLFEMEAEGF